MDTVYGYSDDSDAELQSMLTDLESDAAARKEYGQQEPVSGSPRSVYSAPSVRVSHS